MLFLIPRKPQEKQFFNTFFRIVQKLVTELAPNEQELFSFWEMIIMQFHLEYSLFPDITVAIIENIAHGLSVLTFFVSSP